jgi:hypothetical protein
MTPTPTNTQSEAPTVPDSERKGGCSAMAGSQLAEAMVAWSRVWKIDGDLCRCRECNRGLIISRMDEALIHGADCSKAHLSAPWQDLRSRIPANAPTLARAGEDTAITNQQPTARCQQ